MKNIFWISVLKDNVSGLAYKIDSWLDLQFNQVLRLAVMIAKSVSVTKILIAITDEG